MASGSPLPVSILRMFQILTAFLQILTQVQLASPRATGPPWKRKFLKARRIQSKVQKNHQTNRLFFSISGGCETGSHPVAKLTSNSQKSLWLKLGLQACTIKPILGYFLKLLDSGANETAQWEQPSNLSSPRTHVDWGRTDSTQLSPSLHTMPQQPTHLHSQTQ